MATPSVIVSGDLTVFFRQELTSAGRSLKVPLAPAVEFYLVNLLSSLAAPRARAALLDTEPMAVLLERVADAPEGEQPGLYRALGDDALYRAGFFIESFDKALIDADYYVTMGSAAYRKAAKGHLSLRRQDRAKTFFELADGFAAWVDLLNWVAAKARGRSGRDADVLKLYERYARTRNERTRQILLDCGLSVEAGRDQEPIH